MSRRALPHAEAASGPSAPEGVDRIVLLELPPVARRHGTWRVVVSLETWQGRQSLHVRWNRRADDGTWHPTREGATVPIDRLADLEAAVRRAREGQAPS